MKKKKNDPVYEFAPATENYRISAGTYDFLICKIADSEDNRTISVKCKFLKTAINKVIDKVDSSEEIIDYEVKINNDKGAVFINLQSLGSKHPIYNYLS